MVSTLSLERLSLDDAVIGRYRILFELGRGGTARLFLALAEGPGGFSKLVVLKVPKPHLAREPEYQAMFLTEARLYARLGHPNIVQVVDVIEHEGAPVLVLEYLQGKSLYEVSQRFPEMLSTRQRLCILVQVLEGLHHAHELRDFDGAPLHVVHRDLTPQNVFLTYEGQVKLIDFGIARVAGSVVETGVEGLKGKVRYMAPEQLEGKRVDRRADVFACGVMLWEAITRRRLWQGRTDSEVLSAVLGGLLPSPRDFAPEVELELEAICLQALAREPQDRYSTADSFRRALERYLRNYTPVTSTPVTSRELGRCLAQGFAKDKEETSRAIDHWLRAHALRSESSVRRPSHPSSRPPGSASGHLRRSAPPKPVRSSGSGAAETKSGRAEEPDVVFQVTKMADRERRSLLPLIVFFLVILSGYLSLWRGE